MSPRNLGTAASSVVRYAATLPITTIDPLGGSWNEIASLVYSRPISVDAYGALHGDLIDAWSVADGGRTWRLEPRRGVRWHDGEPFGAADVEHTLRLLADPSNAELLKPSLPMVVDLDREPATDGGPDTVVVALDKPTPGFVERLARAAIVAAHRHGRSVVDAGGLDADPVGTGPYRVVARGDGTAELEAHDGFHDGTPHVGRIELAHLGDDRDRAAAIAAGEFDIGQVKPQHLGELAAAPDVVIHTIATRVWRALTFSLTNPLLSDARVRRAISSVLDRDEVVAEALGGYGAAQYWPTPPSSWAAPSERPPLGADVATSLLVDAGWQRDQGGRWLVGRQPVHLRCCYLESETFRAEATRVIARQLDDFGIAVSSEPITWERYRAMDRVGLRGSGFDLIVVGWSGGVDPYDNLAIRYSSGGAYNRDGYADAELDGLLASAGLATDRDEATKLYRTALEITHRDSIMAPLANPQYLFAARRGLTGFERFEVDSFYEFTQYAHLLRWGDT